MANFLDTLYGMQALREHKAAQEAQAAEQINQAAMGQLDKLATMRDQNAQVAQKSGSVGGVGAPGKTSYEDEYLQSMADIGAKGAEVARKTQADKEAALRQRLYDIENLRQTGATTRTGLTQTGLGERAESNAELRKRLQEMEDATRIAVANIGLRRSAMGSAPAWTPGLHALDLQLESVSQKSNLLSQRIKQIESDPISANLSGELPVLRQMLEANEAQRAELERELQKFRRPSPTAVTPTGVEDEEAGMSIPAIISGGP